jgi:putative (di)nucleoside polyphosphate hydrolase
MTTLPYRLGVGMMLLNKAGDVFVGRRIDTRSDAWQMPQGGIDQGEDPQQAAVRELEEEVGVSNVRLLHESAQWYSYDLPKELVPVLWKGRYQGQKQRWFAYELMDDDAAINIATQEPEFNDWKWVSIDELPSLIVPFKMALYQSIVDEFKPVILEKLLGRDA